jgi:phosphoribosylanthranilate isomerase
MSVNAKICGITTKEAIESAIKGGAYFVGFVFFPKSPRYVTPEKAAELAENLPPGIKKVAVMVDPTDDEIESVFEYITPDYLQLHGAETPERVREIRATFSVPVIKAIKVRSSDDVALWGAFSKVADMLLFDARAPESSPLPGGNGLVFDWTLIKNRKFTIPWMLSGGLNSENLKHAIELTGARMVDASSSLENQPGIKDPKLVREFLETCVKL